VCSALPWRRASLELTTDRWGMMKQVLTRFAGAALALSACAAAAVTTSVPAADATVVSCPPRCEVGLGNRDDPHEHERAARIGVHASAPILSQIVIVFRTVHVSTDDFDLVPIREGTVTIPAGATRSDIVVSLRDDDRCEPTERFRVELLSASSGTIVDPVAEMDVVDDDCPS
jgi:hypothetical protein